MQADSRAWLQHAVKLSEAGSVPKDLVNEYVSAASELRRLRQRFPSAGETEAARFGMRLEPGTSHELALEAAETKFQEAVRSIIDTSDESAATAGESDSPSPDD